MNFTELEILLFLLCCLFGWIIHNKQITIHYYRLKADRYGNIIRRVCFKHSVLVSTSTGIEEVVLKNKTPCQSKLDQ